MDDTAARSAAEALVAEHKAGTKFKALPGLAAMRDAYDIQDKYVPLLRAVHGEPIGYKVGLTSKAMQTFCGIDHPIAGVVLARRVHRSGASVRRTDYGRIGLEFEIAVRMRSDMPDSASTPEAVAALCRRRRAGDRVRRRSRRRLRQSRREIAGRGQFLEWRHRALAVRGELAGAGAAARQGHPERRPVGEGYGRDILGHPFNSVAWLTAQLASRGEASRPTS